MENMTLTGLFFFIGLAFGIFAMWAGKTGPVASLREAPMKLWVMLAAWSYARLVARKQFEQVHALVKQDFQRLQPDVDQQALHQFLHAALEYDKAT